MKAVEAVLASANRGKLDELRSILPDWTIEPLDADVYPAEDGESYVDNARIKARFGQTLAPGAWVLGDDSGVEVAALDGAPGVRTARWAGNDHVGRLLAALEGVEDRRARYACELVCVAPDGTELRGTGILEGMVATEPAGAGGFGFDPVFVPAGETQTVAELGNKWKRVHSHRARAAQALLGALD